MIYIVEGFEMTGKSTFAKKFAKKHNLDVYRCDYSIVDKTIGRDQSWVVGTSVIDLMSKMRYPQSFVMDRGVISSYTYPKIYFHQRELSEKVIEWYNHSDFFKNNVTFYHFYHENKGTARLLYSNASDRPKDNNKITSMLDQFEDFEKYWNFYEKFQIYSEECYEKLNMTPIKVIVNENHFTVHSDKAEDEVYFI